jgi:glycosyltransferase involved in cell wall biosynthesis
MSSVTRPLTTVGNRRITHRRRVGLDMHVVSGIFQGLRTHVIELFSRVVAISDDLDFVVLCDRETDVTAANDAFKSENVTFARLRFDNPILRLMVDIPRIQVEQRIDVMHVQYVGPIPSMSKVVVTIHDLLFETHPDYFRPMFRLRSKILMRRTAATAAHTFTVSEFSKHALLRYYGLTPSNVTVIHNGVDLERFTPGSTGSEVVLRRNLEPGNYVLTVGRLEPRKNHITLLRAWAALGESAPALVIAGQRDFGYGELMAFLASCPFANRIHLLENVSDAELPALYRNASMFVYPSYAEGFGMPPLEAMASGTPVVCSKATALPEVVGDAGLLVDPSSVAQIRGAMALLLEDRGLAEKLSKAGLAKAQEFSWNAAAARVADVYRALK